VRVVKSLPGKGATMTGQDHWQAWEVAWRPYSLEDVWQGLFLYFRTHGYVRRPGPGRLSRGPADDKWQVCFLLDGKGDWPALLALFRQAGYSPGEPFRRRGKWLVSLSGRRAVEMIEELWDHFAPRGIGSTDPMASGRRQPDD
jgi:hypothetical protein